MILLSELFKTINKYKIKIINYYLVKKLPEQGSFFIIGTKFYLHSQKKYVIIIEIC